MTKKTSSGCTPLSVFYRCPRLMQGLSLMSGLGVLSSGLVVAQTDSPVDRLAVPKTTAVDPPVDLVREAAPLERASSRKAAPAPAPEPAAVPKPAAPESIAVPEASAPKPALERAPSSSWKPPASALERAPSSSWKPPASAPERAPSSSWKPAAPAPERAPSSSWKPAAPAPDLEESAPARGIFVERKPALAAPNLSVPDASTVEKPPKLLLNPAAIQESAKTPIAPSNSYIDRTDYSIGATRRNDSEQPASVVLTERSTGCQTVSQNGQLSSGVCGVAAPSQQTAIRIQQTANSVGTLLRTQLGGVRKLPTPPVASIQPVKLAPVRVIASSIRATPQTPNSGYSAPRYSAPGYSASGYSAPRYSPPGYSASGYSTALPAIPTAPSYSSATGSTTPTGLAYYNLTTRPIGRPSIGQTSFMFPLTIPAALTSAFGWRIHPMTGDHRFHAGTDLGAPQGTPVIAAVSGQVVTADFLGGYGLTVILQHEKGTQESLYAHLSEIFVKPGDMVEQGNVIGRVGSTGNSTGPHLHFEWRHLTSTGWVAVDAGTHLEFALAQFIRGLQVAQATTQRGL